MPRSDAVWKMVPTYLFWCLWRERNDRNFKDREDAKGNFIVVLQNIVSMDSGVCVSFVE
jgi:hypothetical protein